MKIENAANLPAGAAKIADISRCIFPGGKAVLMGYDHDGKEVFGIGIKTKDVVAWARKGVCKGDSARLMLAYVEWLQEQQIERADSDH
jgi:hypothetical protein